MKRILSIAGGGTRGISPARYLAELRDRLGGNLYDHFDLVAGTSTGSILAGMVASPNNVDPWQMVDFYYKSAPKIFPQKWFNPGITGPKYNTYDLQREIKNCIGYSVCPKAKTKILMPILDADNIEAEFVKSWDPFWEEFPIWAGAAASSSAQTYFDAFTCQYRGKNRRWLDGGNGCNLPTASAMFEAAKLWPGEELVVISLGTGRQTNPIPLPGKGLLAWASLVFGVTSECQHDISLYYAKNWHGPAKVYHFDVCMDKFPPMDASDKDTLDYLVALTKADIVREDDRINEACNELLK